METPRDSNHAALIPGRLLPRGDASVSWAAGRGSTAR
jgi:hypothetical protein